MNPECRKKEKWWGQASLISEGIDPRDTPMKITDVKTHRLRYPLREKFANSHGWSTSRSAQVVEIATDDGAIGWGEGTGEVPRAAVENHIIGRNPFDHGAIWQALFDDGISPRAISGIDIALWDLMGKALYMPVH